MSHPINYTKTVYVDFQTPPVDATHLNNSEAGISSACQILDTIIDSSWDETTTWLNQDVRSSASPTFSDLTLSSPSSIYSLSHNSFADYVANEHIDHSQVSISAGTGLSGGGDLTSSRTLSVSFGTTNITVASGSHLHDDRYYIKSYIDSQFYPSSSGYSISSQLSSHISDSTIHYTQSAISVSGSQVALNTLGAPTYDDVTDWFDTFQSTGKVTGGEITDNGDGTITVSSGSGYIKVLDSDIATTKYFDWSTNSSVSLTDNSINYIFVSYNGGSPIIATSTTLPTDRNTNLLLGMVYREGTDVHIVTAGSYVASFPKNVTFKDIEVNGKLQRTSGLSISESGTLNISITSGIVYAGYTRETVQAFDSSGTDTFTYYYGDDTHGWTKITSQTQIDNTQYYDTSTGSLQTLSPNKYGVHWVYEEVDGHVYVVYGTGNYTLSEAELAQPPSELPTLLKELSLLIGKIIIEHNATSFESIESAFTTKFTPSQVFFHNDLASLQGGATDEYYHLSNADYTEATSFFDGGSNSHTSIDSHISSTSNPHNVTKDQIGLGNVPNADCTNASNITSGTLSTDRFSAYDDLVAESKIGSSSTQVASGNHLHNDTYYTKSESDANYYPSSNGTSLYTSFVSHSGNTSNPHQVTASQVGNLTAQWNANKLQGFEIDSSSPSDGDVLTYISSSSKWIPSSQNISTLSDTNISNPISGEILFYNGSNWINVSAPLSFSQSNVTLYSGQSLTFCQFNVPSGKNVYIWNACVSDISGNSISGSLIEILSGSSVVYSTSSNILQFGNPLYELSGDEYLFKARLANYNSSSQTLNGLISFSVY